MGRPPLDHVKEFIGREPAEPVKEAGNGYTTRGETELENKAAGQDESYFWVPYPIHAKEDGEILKIEGTKEKREVTVKYKSGKTKVYKVRNEWAKINVSVGDKIKKKDKTVILENYETIKQVDYHVAYYKEQVKILTKAIAPFNRKISLYESEIGKINHYTRQRKIAFSGELEKHEIAQELYNKAREAYYEGLGVTYEEGDIDEIDAREEMELLAKKIKDLPDENNYYYRATMINYLKTPPAKEFFEDIRTLKRLYDLEISKQKSLKSPLEDRLKVNQYWHAKKIADRDEYNEKLQERIDYFVKHPNENPKR